MDRYLKALEAYLASGCSPEARQELVVALRHFITDTIVDYEIMKCRGIGQLRMSDEPKYPTPL